MTDSKPTADASQDLRARAMAAMGGGDPRTAVALLSQVAEAAPRDAEIQADLGYALETLGDFEGARTAYAAAATAAPDNPVFRYNLGAACQALGLFRDAAQHYADALEREPMLAEAYFNLGVLFFAEGHFDIAAQQYQNALTARPAYGEAAGNLGLTYRRLGKLAEAVDMYRAALELKPDLAFSHINLGIILAETGRHEEAMDCYARALEIDPASGTTRVNLSLTLRALGRPERAAEEALLALAADPGLTVAQIELGATAAALQRTGEGQKATHLIDRWRGIVGEHPILRHAAAALGMQKAPDRADDSYVVDLFDASAKRFDEMIQGLGYRVPGLIAETLASFIGQPDGTLDVLDAGCGTGLAADALRPYARTLAGVDLSGAMLEQAARRRLYDDLQQAELTGWLEARPESFDLVALGDVLCYFGDLGPIFMAMAGAMRHGATAILTVEAADPWAAPFTLRDSGRYSHRRDYADQSLRAAGLVPVELRQTTLRHEGGKPVEGILAVARRS